MPEFMEYTGRGLCIDRFLLIVGHSRTGDSKLFTELVHSLTVYLKGPATLDIFLQYAMWHSLKLTQVHLQTIFIGIVDVPQLNDLWVSGTKSVSPRPL